MKLTTLKPRISESPSRIRPSVIRRVTGRRLQTIRREHFTRQPLCVECDRRGRVSLATELDHKVPLFKGGADSDENRQGLCFDCHAVKTKADLAP